MNTKKLKFTCFPLCVMDFKIVVNDLILMAISNKWQAKKKQLKFPITEKQKYQKTYKKDLKIKKKKKSQNLNYYYILSSIFNSRYR